ncbi:DUF262 domain-containing protein [Synechocystis salina]|uniref:DUF262 domain-containing protein n=1 Tax=Synechocystis salina TaxID=945780 RepID=UPI001D13E6B0|nr:DUF262 domain-containing protein [Synechocystis salina]
MQEIQGKTRTVQELLGNAKYGVDYYQREYQWQTKNISELIDDLTNRFLEDYQPGDGSGITHLNKARVMKDFE